MVKYNLIFIYNNKDKKILMCKRSKEPYKGKYNLIGGKIESGENGLSAAYREMLEETGITNDNIKLYHLMDIFYYHSKYHLEIYVGVLDNEIYVSGEENELFWINSGSNFFDENKYAGNGLIGHILSAFEVWVKNK
jgi:8-oxo-dGTP diphosphatase